MPRTIVHEQAFWSNVDRRGPDECWPWRGLTNYKGYGRFSRQPAQRVAWVLSNREPFPDGMLACHRCDNPSCCNPKHVWPGTPKQNTQDMLSKGRWRRAGEARGPQLVRTGRAPQKPKSHCANGHPLIANNLFVDAEGTRRCRTCAQAATHRYRQKRRSA